MEFDDEDRCESKRPTSGLAHVYWLPEEASLLFFRRTATCTFLSHKMCCEKREKLDYQRGREKHVNDEKKNKTRVELKLKQICQNV